MKRRLYLLKEVRDFASGAFENTAVDQGGIQLGRKGTGHLAEGSYTSPPFNAPPFRNLVPSWNADVPEGTSVELQARVAAGGQWSRWFSFGRWSPFIEHTSPPAQQDELACAEGDTLSLMDTARQGDTAQLRVLLASEDESTSPTVRLMALTVDAQPVMDGDEKPVSPRTVTIPAYSCLVRDPAIGGHIGGATTLAMLLNRWGEDLLPEEIARAAYDTNTGTFENLSFLCAVAGLFGYECHTAFAPLRALRREVWLGHAVAAQVRYRAPALAETEPADGEAPHEAEDDAPPLLPDATVDSNGHLVAVCGFEQREDGEYVLLHDPMASGNLAAQRALPLEQFMAVYTGRCVMLHRGNPLAGSSKLRRQLVQLSLQDGQIHLFRRDESLVPGPFTRETFPQSTLCYTLSGNTAYASNAQRTFYYPRPDETGHLSFEEKPAAGRRMTFYCIGPHGHSWVAEKNIQPAPPEPEATPDGAPPQEQEDTPHDLERDFAQTPQHTPV